MRAKGGGATTEWAVHAARMRCQLENSLARRRLEAHLEVRVPGHQVVRLLIRTLHEDVDDALERGLDLTDGAEQPETHVRRDLIVAGAASVQLAAERADQLA
jgi:hypothetical protein